jgi:hypothetical protein
MNYTTTNTYIHAFKCTLLYFWTKLLNYYYYYYYYYYNSAIPQFFYFLCFPFNNITTRRCPFFKKLFFFQFFEKFRKKLFRKISKKKTFEKLFQIFRNLLKSIKKKIRKKKFRKISKKNTFEKLQKISKRLITTCRQTVSSLNLVPDRKGLIKIISTRYFLVIKEINKYLVDMILINYFRSGYHPPPTTIFLKYVPNNYYIIAIILMLLQCTQSSRSPTGNNWSKSYLVDVCWSLWSH